MKKLFKIGIILVVSAVLLKGYFVVSLMLGFRGGVEKISSGGPVSAEAFSKATGYEMPDYTEKLYYMHRASGLQSSDFFAKFHVSSGKLQSAVDAILSGSQHLEGATYESKPIDKEMIPGTQIPVWWDASSIRDGYYYYAEGRMEYSKPRFWIDREKEVIYMKIGN